MKAIRIHETGGPEVLRLEEIEKPTPKAGEVLMKVAAAGVNYADLTQRQGTYATDTRMPMTMGLEGAGTVEELGSGVTSPGVGSRVVALTSGGYAEYVTAPSNRVIPIPDTLDFQSAAAFPVQGLTAYQVLHESAHVKAGESVLIHAAAGGVGTLAVQLAKLMGVKTVIGTASSDKKLELVRELGADVAINYQETDWAEQVTKATGSKGPDVILEMVGGDIAEKSLQILAPFGRLVVYGAASGQMIQFSGSQLMDNQSVIGYWLTAWLSRPDKIAEATQALMHYLASGKLRVVVGQTFPLEKAAEAHTAIAERKTTGKVVLIV